jgi:hypothetical protein
MAPLDLAAVRGCAARVRLQEFSINETSKVISFLNKNQGVRINVYYSTGTIGTCLNHHIRGKTQLFRRNQTLNDLEQIFSNPRIHTGVGYYHKEGLTNMVSITQTVVPLETDPYFNTTEEEGLRSELLKVMAFEQEILSERKAIEDALQVITFEKQRQLKIKMEAEAEIARKTEAIRLQKIAVDAANAKEIEQKRLQKAAADRQAEMQATQKRAAEANREKQRLENLAIEKRGKVFFGHLPSCDDPNFVFKTLCKRDTACIAMCQGGVVTLNDKGQMSHSGDLPDTIYELMESNKYKLMKYIAFGPYNEHYIVFSDGSSEWGGIDDKRFGRYIRKNQNVRVAFGPAPDSWIAFTDDGGYQAVGMPEELISYLSKHHKKIPVIISVGANEQFSVTFRNGMEYNFLNEDTREAVDEANSYIVRHVYMCPTPQMSTYYSQPANDYIVRCSPR